MNCVPACAGVAGRRQRCGGGASSRASGHRHEDHAAGAGAAAPLRRAASHPDAAHSSRAQVRRCRVHQPITKARQHPLLRIAQLWIIVQQLRMAKPAPAEVPPHKYQLACIL